MPTATRTPLVSPGEAFARRQKVETVYTEGCLKALDVFLDEIKEQALDALDAGALIAASRIRPGAASFTLNGVLQAVKALAENMALSMASNALTDAGLLPSGAPSEWIMPNPYGEQTFLDYVEGALISGPLGELVFRTVASILRRGREEQWSRENYVDELVAALSRDAHPLIEEAKRTGDDSLLLELNPHGEAWDSLIRRLSRTQATSVYNFNERARFAAAGVTTLRWVTRHDNRVRPTHRAADGQVQHIEDPFIVGGYALMWPGDPAGPPQEVMNCRCVLVDAAQPFGLGPPDHTGRAPIAAAQGVNPFGDDVNCQKATLAYEMQRRGYNVVAARGLPYDPVRWDGQAPMYGWFGEEGDFMKWTQFQTSESPLLLGKDRNPGGWLAEKLAQKYPPGTRGIMSVDWEWGGAHALNWEVTDAGTIFIDAQVGKVITAPSAIKDYFYDSTGTYKVLRVDDLPINDSAFRYLDDSDLPTNVLTIGTTDFDYYMTQQIDGLNRAIAMAQDDIAQWENRIESLSDSADEYDRQIVLDLRSQIRVSEAKIANYKQTIEGIIHAYA